MPTVKLVLEYDGFEYRGWQVQRDAPTIQGVLEEALAGMLGEHIRVQGAGRTDAKVHALGQVASFQCTAGLPVQAFQYGLNSRLPRDIVVREARLVPDDFHARFSALGKVYAYRILNRAARAPMRQRYVWHLPVSLDVRAMAAAAEFLVGTHDFTSFQATGSEVKTTERTLTKVSVVQVDDEVVLTCAADGFLRHMVRNIVGTLVEVGRGRRMPVGMSQVIAGRDRRLAGPTAPAQGLVLVRVLYPEMTDDRHLGRRNTVMPQDMRV